MPPLEDWYFTHNGHQVTIPDQPNKYFAAEEFRNRYGYYPQLDEATHSPSH
jgi:hypothetical protein